MSNHHHNRVPKGPAANPSPSDIKSARTAAGLTQTAAGAILHTSCRVWQQWEAGDRRMHPAFWELFRIKSVTNVAGD